MGTEVALSFTALRAQLENERSSLYKIDENIKKIVQTSGRFNNDRFNPTGDYTRGGARLGGRNSFADAGKNDDIFSKRKHETKTVFSRLSARAPDSDGEEEGPGPGKKSRVSSTVCRELPTRAAVLRAQGDDEQARTRNRRIFGSLLGTLQKFKQEEIVLQTKEEKKAQVERKIEEQARLQKEKEQRERKTLFQERDQKKATIKALEAKMMRVQEYEKWEASQKSLGNFILTKSKPHIYWLPKKMSEKVTEKLNSSRKFHETKYATYYRKCKIRKRLELQDELARIEQRCLRRGPGAKENDPETTTDEKQSDHKNSETSENHKDVDMNSDANDDKGRKRDKFAMDVDEKEKEESDGEERHEAPERSEADQKSKEGKAIDDGNTNSTTEPETDTKKDVNGTSPPQEMETTDITNPEPEPNTENTDPNPTHS